MRTVGQQNVLKGSMQLEAACANVAILQSRVVNKIIIAYQICLAMRYFRALLTAVSLNHIS